MSRKWILSLCSIILAAILIGCAARKANGPAERNPTLPIVQPVPTSTAEAPAPILATDTPLPPPPDTETPIPPPPDTETPLPPPVSSGPVISHIEAGQPVTITLIRMLDASNGWAVGRAGQGSEHVLTTADGGQTWRDVTPPEPIPTEGDLAVLGYFADAQTAWVTYHGQNEMAIPAAAAVWRTQDGGQTWQSGASLDLQGLNETYWPSDLVFADAQNGWLLVHVGAGMSHDYVALFRTQDGGQNWTRLLDPFNDGGIQACEKNALIFSSSQNGWLTGNCGGVMAGAFLFFTGDSGQSWQAVTLPTPAEAPDLFSDTGNTYCGTESPVFFSYQVGKLILHCVDTIKDPPVNIYYLYSTEDGGVTWTPTIIPSGAIDFVSIDRGWALSRNLYYTSDGGMNWELVKTVNWDGQFSFVNEEIGWAVARAETDTSILIALVYTTDGGNTWTEIHPTIAP